VGKVRGPTVKLLTTSFSDFSKASLLDDSFSTIFKYRINLVFETKQKLQKTTINGIYNIEIVN